MSRKEFIGAVIIVLLLTLLGTTIIAFSSVKRMSERASYWMNRSVAAEAVITTSMNLNESFYRKEVMITTQWDKWYYGYYDR